MTKALRVMLSAHLLFLKENQTSSASTPRMLSIVSLRVMLFLLTSERYDSSLSGKIVLSLSMSFCSSSSRDWLQVEMLTAVDCDPVPLLLIMEGPTLMVFDETLPVEVDG